MAKKKLDPRTDKPMNKLEITKEFMYDYMKTVATPDDKEWFKSIVSNKEYQKEYKNSLNDTTYIDIDIAKVRELFVERFFSYIKKKKKQKISFIDSIMEL